MFRTLCLLQAIFVKLGGGVKYFLGRAYWFAIGKKCIKRSRYFSNCDRTFLTSQLSRVSVEIFRDFH